MISYVQHEGHGEVWFCFTVNYVHWYNDNKPYLSIMSIMKLTFLFQSEIFWELLDGF